MVSKIAKVDKNIVSYVAELAKLNPNAEDSEVLKKQVEATIEYISALSKIDTTNIPQTSQVTGLRNVFREDMVDKNRMLSQEEALSNANRKHKGFFVVKGLFE